MQVKTDRDWMLEAVATGHRSDLIAPPNPAVGCVIVRDGVELGRGSTQAPGSNHAEIEAIEAVYRAGLNPSGATLYVTLEPCSHYGRTPPCALRIVKEKIARVVVATLDPNPLVAGRGIQILREAGIEVAVGVCEAEALEANKGFLKRMREGLPWTRLKVANTLDGKVALLNGTSQWITSHEARLDAQRLRAQAQGLLTAIGTVLSDDPQMNVRLEGLPSPRKFVMDAMARTPVTAKILKGSPTTIFVSKAADPERCAGLRAAGATLVELPVNDKGHFEIYDVLKHIGSDNVNLLHVEAGAMTNGLMLESGLVDEVVMYVAPALMGEGLPVASMQTKTKLSEIHRLAFHDVERVGPDLRLVLRK